MLVFGQSPPGIDQYFSKYFVMKLAKIFMFHVKQVRSESQEASLMKR